MTQLTREECDTWRVSYLIEIHWHISKNKFKNALMIKAIVRFKTTVTIQGNTEVLNIAHVVKYYIPKEVFYNGSNYVYHGMINKLAEERQSWKIQNVFHC